MNQIIMETKTHWLERHVNWSMALAWFTIGIIAFVLLFITSSESGGSLLFIYGSLALLSFLVGVWGLQVKRRSLSWMFFFLFPFGCIVLLLLKNKNTVNNML
jgi:uncharacterized membrane protein YhaH (DUF805 family)